MTTEKSTHRQVHRFWKLRRGYWVASALLLIPLLFLLASAALAIVDLRNGLSTAARWAGLAALAVIPVAVIVWRIIRPMRAWTRQQAVRGIEGANQHLGQMVRTSEQLRSDSSEGDQPSPQLTTALHQQTSEALHWVNPAALVS